MTLQFGYGLVAFRLLTLCELTIAAMVLPRPPSSPNEIPREIIHGDSGKFNNDRTIYSLVKLNTNVEKPNTDGYRLLEIELRGPDEVDETNIQGLVRAMLTNEDEPQQRHPESNRESNDNHPNPEVIPHSILGVRDIGLSPNYRIHPFADDNDKKTLLNPSLDRMPNEKLYYLKNSRPKVDVNVRGHSGSFTSDSIITKTGNDQTSIIRPPEFHRDRTFEEKNFLEKTKRRPKKYEASTNRRYNNSNENNDFSPIERSYATGEYEPKPERFNEESTTENMAVTSSELPKQIPAPPSNYHGRTIVAQTTPIQKYALRRTDILPGYSFDEA